VAYLLRGSGMNNCHCHDICPCNVDLKPNGPGGECKGAFVLSIREGTKDDVDLSGVNAAMVYTLPDKPSGGNWRIGIVVDSKASDEQTSALEAIFRGQEGGVFGDFSGLYAEFLGVERAPVTYSDGETPKASIGGSSKLAFEALRDGEGTPTKLVNASFGFGTEIIIGSGSGHVEAFGISFDSVWGEITEFEFAG
jgi:hypothetical protein